MAANGREKKSGQVFLSVAGLRKATSGDLHSFAEQTVFRCVYASLFEVMSVRRLVVSLVGPSAPQSVKTFSQMFQNDEN